MDAKPSFPYGILLVIRAYFRLRGLVWPSTQDALYFFHTELGEFYEEMVRGDHYVRNNPEKQTAGTDESKRNEYLDVLMMWLVLGIQLGYFDYISPAEVLYNHLASKSVAKHWKADDLSESIRSLIRGGYHE